jgi:hypothetical protein
VAHGLRQVYWVVLVVVDLIVPQPISRRSSTSHVYIENQRGSLYDSTWSTWSCFQYHPRTRADDAAESIMDQPRVEAWWGSFFSLLLSRREGSRACL